MSMRFHSSATYLLAAALFLSTAAARADSVPTITITSATSGYAAFGDAPGGCSGICYQLSSPEFGVDAFDFVPGHA